MYQQSSSPPPSSNSIPTDNSPGGIRLPPIACAVTGLRDLAAGDHYPIPAKNSFAIGRHVGNDIVIANPTVSRVHAHAQRCYTHLHLLDANSTCGLSVDGRQRASADLHPGGLIELGACALLAMTAPMEASARDLDRILGVPNAIAAALLAPCETRCIVLVGPHGAAHQEIAAAIHRSSAAGPLPMLASFTGRLPSGDELNAFVARTGGGWVVLDAVDQDLRLPAAALERLCDARHKIMFVLAVSSPDDVPAVLTSQRPRTVIAPTMAARLRDAPAATTIDAVLAWRDLPFRTGDLHPDLVGAIQGAPWPGNYMQFADVVTYVARRLTGITHAAAATGLYTHAPTNVVRWALELKVDRRLLGMRGE